MDNLFYMEIFDFVVGIILIFFLFKGFKNGFIIELASTVAIIVGIILAVTFSGVVAHWLSAYITSKYISIIAFFIVLILAIIGVKLLATIIDKIIKAIALSGLNRFAGAIFGTLKAGFILSIILMILNMFSFSQNWFTPEMKEKSYLYNPIENLAPKTLDILNIDQNHLKNRVENYSI